MSIRKHHKFICFLTALMLLFYGTCFNLSQAGSIFACEFSPLSANRFLTLQNTRLSREIAAPDVPNQRVTSNTEHVERNGRRAFTRLVMSVIFSGSIAPNFPLLFRAISKGLHHEARSNIIIVRYIHTKDGRK